MSVKKLTALLAAVFTAVFVMCIFSLSSVAASISKVTKLKATAQATSVTVTWGKKSNVDGYQLYRYNSSKKKWVKVANYKANKATVKSLSPATSYTFKVRAYKKTSSGYVYSPYSDKLKVKTVLSKPSKPKATPGSNYVSISWSKTKNAQGYQVYFYDYSKKAWVKKKTVTKNSAKITDLATVKSYKFRIRAYNKTGKTVYSPYSDTVYFTTTPAKVTNLKVDKISSTSATLCWKKVSKATGYEVYVNEYTKAGKATSYKLKKTTAKASITLSLKSCTYYRFRVKPYYENSSGKKIYGKYATTAAKVTPPAKASGFAATDVTNKSVTLKWKTQENATGYRIYQKQGSSSSKLIATLPSTTSKYKVASLKQLTSYTFYIKVYHELKNGKTNTSSSVSLSVKTDDDKVDSISFTKKKSTLGIGEEYTFKAQVSPSYAANTKVTYYTKSNSVATVNSKGVVTGVAPGKTYIYAKSSDGGFIAKTLVTVKVIKSKSISLPDEITLYVDEANTLSPTFNPSNTTDKSFTVTGKDYTYSYKSLFGLVSNSDTCKFSDYITIDSLGRLIPKKLTIEPFTGNSFSFVITVTAKDSGASATTKLTVAKRVIKVSYNGSDSPWYYGNSAKLNVSVSEDAGFKKSDVIWSSSNKKVATVSTDGTVKCVGCGPVKITASSPDKKQKHSIEIYCTSIAKVDKTYFEQCKVGSTYKIGASVMPSTAGSILRYTSLNPDTVSVDSSGNVKFLKKGTGTVVVSVSDNYSIKKVVFTSGKWTKPDVGSEELFNLAKAHLNSIKKEMPSLVRSDSSVFTNFLMSNTSAQLTADDLQEIFEDFANESTKFIDSLDSNATAAQKSAYYSSVPVAAGQSLAVIEGIDVERHIKSIEVIDNGSYTYDIRFVLNSENMPNADAATTSTAHGKVFDILSSKHLNDIKTALSDDSVTASFSSFAQNYHDSSVTVSINKATGLVENVVYDMNISISITKLSITMSYMPVLNSDLSFDVNNKVKLEVNR